MAKSGKKATGKAKAVIRPAVSVMWDEMPGHYGGAISKRIVRPETCGAKALDCRISVYQPCAYVAPHRHRIQEQISGASASPARIALLSESIDGKARGAVDTEVSTS